MSESTQEQQINIDNDLMTFELTVKEVNGLLTALNISEQTPAIVKVGYINRIASQTEKQVPRLIEIKKAMLEAAKNATANKEEKPNE